MAFQRFKPILLFIFWVPVITTRLPLPLASLSSVSYPTMGLLSAISVNCCLQIHPSFVPLLPETLSQPLSQLFFMLFPSRACPPPPFPSGLWCHWGGGGTPPGHSLPHCFPVSLHGLVWALHLELTFTPGQPSTLSCLLAFPGKPYGDWFPWGKTVSCHGSLSQDWIGLLDESRCRAFCQKRQGPWQLYKQKCLLKAKYLSET